MKTTSSMRRTSTCDIRLVRMEQTSQPFFPETPLHDTSVHTSYSVQARTSLSVRATYEQGAMYCGPLCPIIRTYHCRLAIVAARSMAHTNVRDLSSVFIWGWASRRCLQKHAEGVMLCATKRWRYEAANMTSCIQYLVLDGGLVPQSESLHESNDS